MKGFDQIDDLDFDRDARVHVHIDEHFISVDRGRQRWCFPTGRTLTPEEGRTLDALMKLYREQT